MVEPVSLPPGVSSPDFYIAAMGRSGSTMLCNWLSHPPDRMVFIEPFFLHRSNPRLLRIQLDDFGMPVTDEDWVERDETPSERFARIMAHRLAGKRWALKEVLCDEHRANIAAFRPPKVIITVRNIIDVALSFFEKHRIQDNLDRFSDQWVVDYCVREAAGLVDLYRGLEAAGHAVQVVRYEDFTASPSVRVEVENFLGWPGGGNVGSHLGKFDRAFEVERHGSSIATSLTIRSNRSIGPELRSLASEIASWCNGYQNQFGYRPVVSDT